ncbi:helix-turn-helix transcriptional regulator [Actinomadura terrae]|uniref:helix-turn-helix transcriptional regulator n=1 Tax=Actinomadura terrae TaxID=604353 RepID=UPI001FA7CE16|nr:LuxR family transcriptional regulator [Actinomadura terrae]
MKTKFPSDRWGDRLDGVAAGRPGSLLDDPSLATPPLVGRDAELRSVDRFLDRTAAHERGGSVVLAGAPGIGKTRLLEEIGRRAPSACTVLRCSGTPAERTIPFAGLHQLLFPLRHHLDRLPGTQIALLNGVFGVSEPPRGRLSAPCAALALLALAAERAPLLLLVDDAHRLDEASLDALAFVARRLRNLPVAMIFATREHGPRSPHLHGLPEARLEPLSPTDTCLLIAKVTEAAVRGAPRYDRSWIDHIARESAGNPLIAVELAAALAAGGPDGASGIPPSPRLRATFGDLVAELPEPTRWLLLIAAANDKDDLGTTLSAAAMLGFGTGELAPAERSMLATVDGDELSFQPPFLRTVVYRNATVAERKTAHGALAEATAASPHRRVHHLASAAHEPDEAMARQISEGAGHARRVDGMVSALHVVERAATLSRDPATRTRFLIDAASCAWQAGLPVRARALERQIAPPAGDPRLLAAARLLRGTIAHAEAATGAGAGHRALLASALDTARADPVLAARLLVTAARTALDTGHRGHLAEIGGRLLDLPLEAGHPAKRFGAALRRVADRDLRHAGDIDATAAGLLRLTSTGEPVTWPAVPPHVPAMGAAARDAFAQTVRELRSQGAAGTLPLAAVPLIALEHLAGRWDEAAALGAEALALADQTGQRPMTARIRVMLALTAAARDPGGCRELVEAALRDSAPGHDRATRAMGHWALGRSALSARDPYSAIPHYTRITSPDDDAHHYLIAFLAFPDLVECHVMAGQLAEARALLESADEWRLDEAAPHLLGPLLRARALLASRAEDAERLLDEAILHSRECPFERARAELQLGKLLRRQRRIKDARRHLHAAVAAFTALRAEPWLDQASAELRATGYARPSAGDGVPGAVTRLTPQELRIARFASEGLTNPEIALRLSISSSTVRYHLSKIFQKLDITSRRQLLRSNPTLAE